MTTDFGAEPPRAGRSRVRAEALVAAGLDPGAGRSPWGLAVVECRASYCVVRKLFQTRESQEALVSLPPAPTGVDAPLTPPYKGYRDCERAALKMGARLLPGGSRGMSMLSARGYSIKVLLQEAGIPVYEVHPASFARASGAPGKPPATCCSIHEWHAVLASLAAVAAWRGEAVVAEGRECRLIVGIKRSRGYRVKIGGVEVALGGRASTS